MLLDVELPWQVGELDFLLPLDSHLSTFYLTTYVFPHAGELLILLQEVTTHHNNLEVFVFKALGRGADDMFVLDYPGPHDGVPLLLSFAKMLPSSLRRLQLEYCADLNIGFLPQVAESCPLLEELNLEASLWSAARHSVGSTAFEDSITHAIDLLPKLKILNLGWLPLVPDKKLRQVEQVCRQRDISLSWMTCRPGFRDDESEGSGWDDENRLDDDGVDLEDRRVGRWRQDHSDDEGSWVDAEDDMPDQLDHDDLPEVEGIDKGQSG